MKAVRTDEISPLKCADLWKIDDDTGEISWAATVPDWITGRSTTWFRKKLGSPAFSGVNQGYKTDSFYGRRYYAQRVAFCLYHGRWPVGVVDHIDQDKKNNRKDNLRECSVAENIRNSALTKAGTSSSFRGVSLCKQTGRFSACIMVNRKYVWLGRYDTEIAAAEAYDVAAQKYHGAFASTNLSNAQPSRPGDVLAR